MGNETQVVESAAQPSVKPKTGNNYQPSENIMNSFRKAADPENKTGKNPEAKKEPVKEVKQEANQEVKQDKESANQQPKEESAKVESNQSDKEINFERLRKLAEEKSKKLEETEKLLKDLQNQVHPDYDEIKKVNDELIKEIEKTNLERSPRFKDKYDKPLEKTLGTIKKTLSNTDVIADDIINIIKQPDSKERTQKLAEALDEMDKLSQGKVTKAIADFDDIRAQRQSELESPTNAYQQYKNEEAFNEKQSREQDILLINKTLENAEKTIEWFKENGNEEWDNLIKTARHQAKSMWTEKQPKEALADATFKASLTPIYEATISRQFAQIEALNKQLAELRATTPKNSAGISNSSESKSKSSGGAIEAFHRGAGR